MSPTLLYLFHFKWGEFLEIETHGVGRRRTQDILKRKEIALMFLKIREEWGEVRKQSRGM